MEKDTDLGVNTCLAQRNVYSRSKEFHLIFNLIEKQDWENILPLELISRSQKTNQKQSFEIVLSL